MLLHFNEDTRVKFPATIQFLRLNYDYQSLKDELPDFETKIFVNRFKKSLEIINKRSITNEEITALLEELNLLMKQNDLGKGFYQRLISTEYNIKLLDLDNYNNNNFAVVDELPFSVKEGTEEGSFRPDINILINGMPLAFLEVKKPNNDGGIQVEFNRMINNRLKNPDYKKYFNMLQIVAFSNNMEYEEPDDATADMVRAGSFYTTPNDLNTTFSFFREDIPYYHAKYKLKNISDEAIKEVVEDNGYIPEETDTPEFKTNLSDLTPCNRFITSLFDKERLIYMLRYGIMFLTEIKKVKNALTGAEEEIPLKQKHIMRYPQFFATRAIIDRLGEKDRNGIIWHTQGSGKTALSAFANKVIKDYYASKNVNARFFYIVDRLDLMTQAILEYKNRGFTVTQVSSKSEFGRELKKPLDQENDGTIGTVCIVNIHKIMEEGKMPPEENAYNVNTQRIFFVDEAHRSYSMHGEFFKNLMTCDKNGVYIAMTGTPLLTKKERSNLKFGDYIHTYFYDKSIADGYTLRIKKEQIDTTAKATIRANLDLENTNLDSADVYESDDYVSGVSKFIESDFQNFRYINTDDTIGAMIVCRSNPQAKSIHQWFKNNSKFTTGLVMSDSENTTVQNDINKQNQLNFRNNGYPDILVVHYMLTTGYDVKRLKKMYLLRGPKAQNLLQTISRVNRPYKNPHGKVYQYGYITDFVDIEKDYKDTLDAYLKELEDDMNGDEEGGSLTGLVVDKETIKRRFDKLVEELSLFIMKDNVELFSRHLENYNKEALYKIRKLLMSVKECSIEFKLSRADEYTSLIDDAKVNTYLKVVNDRISFNNLQTQVVNTLDIMNNDEVVDIIYEFIKTKISILDLSKFTLISETIKDEFEKSVDDLQQEIKKNKNKKDIKIQKLEDLLQKIFARLQIIECEDLEDFLSSLSDEIKQAYLEAKKINEENERVSKVFGGSFAFVRTISDSVLETSIDRSKIEEFLSVAYEELKGKTYDDVLIHQGREGFIADLKKKITTKLIKKGLYVLIKDHYENILTMLYFNLLSYKESI